MPVPSQKLDFLRHMSWSFFVCIQWVKMRGDCSFCWYWWNCWPSLFNLSFHKMTRMSILRNQSTWCMFTLFRLSIIALYFSRSLQWMRNSPNTFSSGVWGWCFCFWEFSYLIYVICVCLRIVVSNTYCVVFLFLGSLMSYLRYLCLFAHSGV